MPRGKYLPRGALYLIFIRLLNSRIYSFAEPSKKNLGFQQL